MVLPQILRRTQEQPRMSTPTTPPHPSSLPISRPKVDPAKEFAGIRKHLANLEQLVLRPAPSPQTDHDPHTYSLPHLSDLSPAHLEPIKRESPELSTLPRSKAPGILHRQPGGLYAGTRPVIRPRHSPALISIPCVHRKHLRCHALSLGEHYIILKLCEFRLPI